MQPPDPIQVRFYGKSGPWVVLLHGGPGAPGEMAPVARRLGHRFRVLEPFEHTSGDVPLTVARHVADLAEVLREPLREGPVRLVGFSWGAMLALAYAARRPGDVDRLVLIGCGTFDRRSREAYVARMAQRMSADDRRRIQSIEARLAVETHRGRRNALFAELGSVYARVQSFEPLAISSEETLPCDEAGFRETWEDALSLQERGVQPAEFTRIRAPVVMIHGDEDPHPGPLIHESLARFIPDVAYRELPRCGHKPWIEREARDGFFELLTECLG